MVVDQMQNHSDRMVLLGEELIEDHPNVALDVLGYATKFGIGLGWHYLLDIVWILNGLRIRPGATVLEAGAGSGLLQFILACEGYNVVSVDMMDRKVPQLARILFDVRDVGATSGIEHPYKVHRRGKEAAAPVTAQRKSLLKEVFQPPLRDLPRRTVGYLSGGFRNQVNGKEIISKAPETVESAPVFPLRTADSGNRQVIVLYHCDLRHMDQVPDDSIDALVSVSAIEHNRPEEMTKCVDEFMRVLKPGGSMHLTISASHPESSFHEPSHSWLLNEKDIVRTFHLKEDCETNFKDFDQIREGLRNSKYLSKWLAAYYFISDKSGMPGGKWDPAYVPVGIMRRKT